MTESADGRVLGRSMTDEQLIAVMRTVFISLGQAMGPKVIVNSSVLLAQLASQADPKVKEMLEGILIAVDGGEK